MEYVGGVRLRLFYRTPEMKLARYPRASWWSKDSSGERGVYPYHDSLPFPGPVG